MADVVDGDTIEVSINGSEEDVRYIGVDTPESVKPGAAGRVLRARGAASSTSGWSAASRCASTSTPSAATSTTRLLAYVYVGGARSSTRSSSRRGYATTLTIAAQRPFAGLFDRLEQEAGNAGRGLWGAC